MELRQIHATKMFVLLVVDTNANILWEKELLFQANLYSSYLAFSIAGS